MGGKPPEENEATVQQQEDDFFHTLEVEELEGVPGGDETGSCDSCRSRASVDATPVTDRCILGDFLTEAPATPQQEQAYVDEFLVRDPAMITARQASATKLDALCRKARILRAATAGDYGDALAAGFPEIRVDSDRVVVDEGDILTSGGIMSIITWRRTVSLIASSLVLS